TLKGFERPKLCSEHLSEFFQQLWRLVRVNAGDEGRIVDALNHKAFGGEPDRHSKHNLVLEIDPISSLQALTGLMLDQCHHCFCAVGRSHVLAEQPVEDHI